MVQMGISIIENFKHCIDQGTQLKDLKIILMEHYNLSVNSTLNTTLGNDEGNRSNNYTQIINKIENQIST